MLVLFFGIFGSTSWLAQHILPLWMSPLTRAPRVQWKHWGLLAAVCPGTCGEASNSDLKLKGKLPILVGGGFITILKNDGVRQWEGLSWIIMDYPIYDMENKSHVWNHQPVDQISGEFPPLKWPSSRERQIITSPYPMTDPWCWYIC